MQDTRQQILEILKRHGEITVQELSTELTLTSVTVRHHLEILRAEGYITDPEVKRSNRPGRPRYVYKLTSMAADLFPNNYSGLANALLDALNSVETGKHGQILQETAHQLSADAGKLAPNREQRLDNAIKYMKHLGFVSRWEREESGEYYLYTCNCPYHYVAQTHPEVCMIDKIMLRDLLGADVELAQGRASSNALCSHKILWPDDLPEK